MLGLINGDDCVDECVVVRERYRITTLDGQTMYVRSAEEVEKLDIQEVQKEFLVRTSKFQDWVPASEVTLK